MTQKYTIETLTPLHIGSGRELLANSEFVYFPKEKRVAVVDEHKVLAIIGEDHIEQWMQCISSKKPLFDLLKQRKHDLKVDDIAKYSLSIAEGVVAQKQNIREYMRSNGRPLLPGSTIKGSIRTAIFNRLLKNKPQSVERFLPRLDRNNPKPHRFSDTSLLKQYFGYNPNENSMRFLQVGDALFNDEELEILQCDIMNIGYRGTEVKRGAEQLVEAIPSEASSTVTLKLADQQLIQQNKLQVSTDFLRDYSALADEVNKHTSSMLKDELVDLKEDFDMSRQPFNNTFRILKQLQEHVEEVRNSADGTMILRMGFGVGWTFTTGGWVKDDRLVPTEDMFDAVRKASRPNRRRVNYGSDIAFPKTRKMSNGGNVLGFVKLSPQ